MNSKFLISLILFILINIALYFFIIQFHNLVRFNSLNYELNAHHYLPDTRFQGRDFDLFNALGQFDAQWYLKIADSGYPKNPQVTNMEDKRVMDGLTYAFFPLYPWLISLIDKFINNIELSAFVLTQVLLIANFVSLYFAVQKLFTSSLALKTVFLFFLYPLSIFYRSYFAEGLLLLLLIWFSYFLIQKRYVTSAIFISLLNITKGNILLLNLLFIYYWWQNQQKSQPKVSDYLVIGVIILTPLLFWSGFNFIQTGHWDYFLAIQSYWFKAPPIVVTIYNFALVTFFLPFLPLHYFHASKIDSLMILVTLLLLVKSFKVLPRKLWWISFLVWLTPLLIKDTLSFSRLQIISFPLFIYLAMLLKRQVYFLTIFSFGILLFFMALLFINWYWIG